MSVAGQQMIGSGVSILVSRLRRKRMPMHPKSSAVLDAANNWLTAIENMAAAEEAQSEREAYQEDLDAAEVELTAAVKAWRLAERPT
jgi:hypothetical protein